MARGATDARGNVLIRIKRAVLAGRYAFSEKARLEMETDGLTELDIAESILNAVEIYKTVRSGGGGERGGGAELLDFIEKGFIKVSHDNA